MREISNNELSGFKQVIKKLIDHYHNTLFYVLDNPVHLNCDMDNRDKIISIINEVIEVAYALLIKLIEVQETFIGKTESENIRKLITEEKNGKF